MLVVPVDFTPVSHEALLYACELSVDHNLEIVAVHVLDTKIIETFRTDDDAEVRASAELLQKDMVDKAKKDLDNFLDGLSVFYGDIIHPLVVPGTIFEAFNAVAETYHSPLIVMGTHGIVGLQHVFGSKAYKVVLQTPYPFLVVQERSFNVIGKLYLALKSANDLEKYAADLTNFAGFFKGNFHINILSEPDGASIPLPEALGSIADRISIDCQPLAGTNICDAASAASADAIGICIDEADNRTPDTYGMTQDKILINKYKLPVLCLPYKA